MAYSATDSQDEAIQRTIKRNKMLAYAAQNAPPLTTGRPTLDARGAPQSQPMQGAPSIIPPMQPDWSAAFAPKGGAAPTPAPPGGFGAVRMAERGAVDQPAANPQRDMIEEKRRLAALRSDRMKILWDGDRGLDPEAKAARIAAIRGAGAQIENIEGANRPIPQAQDAEQIAGGKRELWSQGLSMAEAKMRALIPRVQAEQDPTRRDALTSELTHYRTVAQAFTTRLQGPEQDYGTDPAIQAAVAGQQKSREMAERSRGKYEEKVSDDAMRHLAAVTLSREIAAKRGALEGAGLDTALAQTKQAGAEATIGADPKVIESNIKARQFQAAAAAAKAKTEAGALEGGQPTPASAAIAQQRQQATLTQYGIDDRFTSTITQHLSNLSQIMSDIHSGKISGGAFGGAEGGVKSIQAIRSVLPQLEQAAGADPETAARIARYILADPHFPMPGADGTYTSSASGGSLWGAPLGGVITSALPVNQRNRAMVAMGLTEIRRRLEAIAGAAGQASVASPSQ